MTKQIFKSILFVFVVHLLAVFVMFAEDDGLWFVFMIALCLITIPAYFAIKADPPQRWLYTLTSIATHVVLTLLVYFVFSGILSAFLPTDWPAGLIHFTETFLSAAFCIVFLIDLVVNVKS